MKKLFYLFVLAVTFTSCVKDTDYDTPQVQGENPSIDEDQLSSIQNAISHWAGINSISGSSIEVDFATNEEPPVYISGYVTSDDRTGNFYKELYIQDSINNPQHAVKLMIDVASLYTKFDKGKKVYVKLNGLTINKVRGEMVIGQMVNGIFDNILENKAKDCILRDINSVAMTPKNVEIADFNESLVGMYVQIDSLQFDQDVLGMPFVDPFDSYDSYRSMVSCGNGGNEVTLETSTFATFKQQILPSGKGTVKGILTRNYDDNKYVIRVNSPEDFTFIGERCDPPFQDGFTNGFQKWTRYSVTGAQNWVVDDYNGISGNYAKMSGYQNGNFANEDWLITKPINLSEIANAKLNFKTARNYSGNNLVVYISTNYNGSSNPNTSGTWTQLNATLSTGSWTWTDSGDISLTPYCGQATVYIAFKYTSTSSAAATYEIDNVKITEL